jgi:2-C-methyl-D-erythritol 4-phosphate cytidylyltransferase
MRSAIIVAGGTGTRMGGPVPKQFLLLRGKPLLCWSIEAFRAYDAVMPIVVVLPERQIIMWRTLCMGHGFHVEHTVVPGGAERFHSVQHGLATVEHTGIVAVHDGARPLIDVALIDRCFAAAALQGTAIPVVTMASSVREVTGDTSKALDRTRLRVVQTPQCFRVDLLRQAFAQPYDPLFTDEAAMVERIGVPVHLVEGDERNIKVTTPLDLRIAATQLED